MSGTDGSYLSTIGSSACEIDSDKGECTSWATETISRCDFISNDLELFTKDLIESYALDLSAFLTDTSSEWTF
ncbi:hypothetical protein TrVE_jg3985 [Triparma verrucosa]|uniref:Uncharacterized protein n=1 Tax=Triparma verrucosa TaxID=1606542 RepID=A0A9W7ENQ1_9STRA|nr:hypothetical protein TrVE_jg3985 [Triparma verrucosa]